MSLCTVALCAATRANKKRHSLVQIAVAHTAACRECHAQLMRNVAAFQGCRCLVQSWPCSTALNLKVHLSATKLAATGPIALTKHSGAVENDCSSNASGRPAAEPSKSIPTCAVDWHPLRSQLIFQPFVLTQCCANMRHPCMHCLQPSDDLLCAPTNCTLSHSLVSEGGRE